MTINTLEYNGTFQPYCNFAGLVAYDQTEGECYEEISTVCKAHDNYHYYKNVYSKGGTMLIVMYSYKKYSSFKLNLTLSTVTCKTIRINVCEFEPDSQNLQNFRFFPSDKEKCVILQLGYGMANTSLFQLKQKITLNLNEEKLSCKGNDYFYSEYLCSKLQMHMHTYMLYCCLLLKAVTL